MINHNKFPDYSSIEQTKVINELLGNNGVDKALKFNFSLSDAFKILPSEIVYKERRGDLSISCMDIAYFSIDGSWHYVLIHYEKIESGGDIFDAFIKMIKWLKENNLM